MALVAPGRAFAAIVNGDFSSGDLSGWTATAIDAEGNLVEPLIEVVDLGGIRSAVFSTGTFADGPFISTLQQTFVVGADAPVLSFDLSLPTVSLDLTGDGQSPFSDTLVVSIEGADLMDLLLVYRQGAIPDFSGTAPGPVALGPSGSALLQYNFRADLSALVGNLVTLYLDVINEDDGFVSVFDPTAFRTQATLDAVSKIPESKHTMMLLGVCLGVMLFARRRR